MIRSFNIYLYWDLFILGFYTGMQQDIPIFKQKGFKLFLERCQRYLWISETVRQNVQSIPSNRSTITETSVRTNCFAWNIRNEEKSRRGGSQFHPSWNNRCWNKATWKVDRGCSMLTFVFVLLLYYTVITSLFNGLHHISACSLIALWKRYYSCI